MLDDSATKLVDSNDDEQPSIGFDSKLNGFIADFRSNKVNAALVNCGIVTISNEIVNGNEF